MKKTLIAVAALAATGAFAQVSVYGRLDAGYTNHTSTSSTGVETKLNGVNSHNSVSSMWGIQGSEDLGGGMKAIFKLEQDIYTANGNTGNSGSGNGVTNSPGFNRTSMVGVAGGFGTVAFGRDYLPMFKMIASSDVFAQTRLSTVNASTVAGDSTAPDQIFYSTPNMGGFSANISYTNQDTSSGTTNAKTTGNNLTGIYSNGPLMVGAGVGSKEVTTGANIVKNEGTAIVASYNFGVVKVSANTISGKVITNGVAGADNKEVNLGVSAPMGKVTLLAAFGTNDNGATANNTGQDMVIGADYALSAKTALYAKTGTVRKFGDAKQTGTTLGIKTTF